VSSSASTLVPNGSATNQERPAAVSSSGVCIKYMCVLYQHAEYVQLKHVLLQVKEVQWLNTTQQSDL